MISGCSVGVNVHRRGSARATRVGVKVAPEECVYCEYTYSPGLGRKVVNSCVPISGVTGAIQKNVDDQ